MDAPLFILSGASGAGKTTHMIALIKAFPSLHRIATYTTRSARPGEVDGIDYVFVCEDSFATLVSEKKFIETNKYGTTWYGTHIELLERLKRGQPCIVVPDINGAIAITKVVPTAVPIWLCAPPDILQERLAERGTENKERMEQRLALASKENATAAASGIYQHVVDTSDFDTAFAKLSTLVKERL